jgi:hypothetical protein
VDFNALLEMLHDVLGFAVCNRTYYGDVSKTYELELHKPREDRLPFLCQLTFMANGHNHGELVQVSNSTPWHETMPTERPPLVGEVSANFCRIEGVVWPAQRIPTAIFSYF